MKLSYSHSMLFLVCLTLLSLVTTGCSPKNPRPDLKPDFPAPLYLVTVGEVPQSLITGVIAQQQAKLGLTLELLEQLPRQTQAVDLARNQIDAERLSTLFQSKYKTKAPCHLLVVTQDDIFDPNAPNLAFVFSYRSYEGNNGVGVISTRRMDDRLFGQPYKEARTLERLNKMVTKNIGVLYYRLPTTSNVRSAMYGPVLGLNDLDRMGTEL